MAAPEEGEARRAFPAFPYPPYDIQQSFMQALYAALEKGGVGLFESPTGEPGCRRQLKQVRLEDCCFQACHCWLHLPMLLLCRHRQDAQPHLWQPALAAGPAAPRSSGSGGSREQQRRGGCRGRRGSRSGSCRGRG
ncbi:hypothetical protein ABPG75_008787 [Micractinium tetrahymenae]